MSALHDGFAILDAVTAAGHPGLTFSGIVDATGLPKATTHRLLKALSAMGALTFDANSRLYAGGLLLARLGGQVISDFDLRRTVRPALEALHEATGHVATLAVMAGTVGVYIDKIESTDLRIRLHSELGKQFPLHCTAMGKTLLAHARDDVQEQVLAGGLESYTPNTITDPHQLRLQFADILRHGYALDREEITRGLVCVAAPVRGVDGLVAGALSCTFPSYLAEERGIETEIQAVLRASAPERHKDVRQ